MSEPKRYKAELLQRKGTVFEGYYIKHIYATPSPIDTAEGRKKFIENHTKHYIVTDGFSDWNLPREMRFYEIDIDTLEEVKE